MDTAQSQPADLALPLASEPASTPDAGPALGLSLVHELWRAAEAEKCGLSIEELGSVLAAMGEKVNYSLPPGTIGDAAQRAAFFRSLHLAEFALAQACALGHEPAWAMFLSRYRAALVQAAIGITGSSSLGEELADSLYAELYGLRDSGEGRRSPLASYSGRGSLAGWLRTTLVQRYRDHHRRTWREEPLDAVDRPAPEAAPAAPADLARLTAAVSHTLGLLAAEDRFLLAAYFLDRQTLLQIAQLLRVHEATVSRRIKRLAESVRKQLIQRLVGGGLSKAAAEDALGADPRDIEINLRALLQTSQSSAFSSKKVAGAASISGPL